jgi:hypothetical protein
MPQKTHPRYPCVEVTTMTDWLDTETKTMLQHVPPQKFAPPETGLFTLVLLSKGNNSAHLMRALDRIRGLSPLKSESLLMQHCPLRIAGSLSIGDAMLGQFELICCDSISIFLRDEVYASSDSWYLTQLYQQIRESPEFEHIKVKIASVPKTTVGEHFVDQFLGGPDVIPPLVSAGLRSFTGNMMRKKARIMAHWAEKIGAEVAIADKE